MVGKLKGDLMATIKEVYELLTKKQAAGEKIGMFGESLVEEYEKEDKDQTTKKVSLTFIKKKQTQQVKLNILTLLVGSGYDSVK